MRFSPCGERPTGLVGRASVAAGRAQALADCAARLPCAVPALRSPNSARLSVICHWRVIGLLVSTRLDLYLLADRSGFRISGLALVSATSPWAWAFPRPPAQYVALGFPAPPSLSVYYWRWAPRVRAVASITRGAATETARSSAATPKPSSGSQSAGT